MSPLVRRWLPIAVASATTCSRLLKRCRRLPIGISWARALRDARIVITNDKDFGELVFRSGQAHHGVVLLRLSDESVTNRVYVVKTLLEQYAARLAGRFTVATEGRVRIRPTSELP